MTPQIEGWVGLAVQIPLVGLFIWFSLQLISYFLKSIDQRDAAWREFLRQQQDANNAAVKAMAERFADAIRSLDKSVSELKGKMDGNNQ
jgi:hypothetical protein